MYKIYKHYYNSAAARAARVVLCIALAAAGLFCFAGCSFFVEEETAATGGQYNYVSTEYPSTEYPSSEVPSSEVPSSEAPAPSEPSGEITETEPAVSEIPSLQPMQPTLPDITEPTAIRPTVPDVPAQTPDVSESVSDVDLSIELPEPNGEMLVSRDPSNPLIRTVHESRGVDSSLLVAVYSVPASSQNYVFEFTSASRRTENDLRRVYLLDNGGGIVSVAAASNGERENLSVTENWFDFTVLIKGVIFPAVKDRMAG